MPWDRVWAVAHEVSKAEPGAWARCANFGRAASSAELMAITSELDEATETTTLRHPARPDLIFRPDDQPEALLQWLVPLLPQSRAKPSHIMRLDERGYTDSPFASVALCNLASHAAVEQHLDRPLSIHRWRGNIWIDGLNAWEEMGWIGKEIRLGDCLMRVREPATRCLATAANPETGKRDAETLKALAHFGHQEFSMLAEVIKTGRISAGDPVEVL